MLDRKHDAPFRISLRERVAFISFSQDYLLMASSGKPEEGNCTADVGSRRQI